MGLPDAKAKRGFREGFVSFGLAPPSMLFVEERPGIDYHIASHGTPIPIVGFEPTTTNIGYSEKVCESHSFPFFQMKFSWPD